MTDFRCGFCGRSFRSEGTLAAHMCEPKRRRKEQNSVSSRLGLALYQRFFELNSPGSRTKTFEDFADSKYYKGFIRLSRHLQDLRPIEQDRFVDWLFQNGIKEREWCKDRTYERYITDLLVKENTTRALERSIKTMERWAEENDSHFSRFFAEVSTNEATLLLRYGRISPWALYMASTADALWERLNEEQADIVGSVIDPKVWLKRFEKNREDCEFVQEILNDAGL